MQHPSSHSRFAAIGLLTFVAAACDSMGGKGDSSLQAAIDSTRMVAADSAPALTDGNIFAMLDMANAHDSAGGVLGAAKGTSADVKSFGRQMVLDHHALRKDGQDLARTLGVTAEMPLNDSTQTMHDSVSAALKALPKGTAFDRAYMDHQVGAHQEVLNKVRSLRGVTKNAEIQGLVEKATLKIQEHLDKATDIQRKLGGGVVAKADSAQKAP